LSLASKNLQKIASKELDRLLTRNYDSRLRPRVGGTIKLLL